MTSVPDFTQLGTRGFFQPFAHVTIDEGVAMIAAAVSHARDAGLADLVINTLGFSGFAYPNVIDRYALALGVVANAGGTLRVAFVVKPELIDFQKIGMVMVQNRGIISDVFPTEAEALAWLDSRRPPAGADRSASKARTANDE